MKLHSVYGPSLPESGWVPAPRYLLRRQLVLNCLKNENKSNLLEIGSGPAVLLYELASNGWNCSALERSVEALKIAKKLHNQQDLAIIHEQPESDWSNKFNWILAMEVLEHIDDDFTALREWATWIKPGGKILLSVPAHQKKWNSTDVWAGHYRRYEKDQLVDLFEKSGFQVEKVMSYGFPLANIIEPIRAWHHGRLLKEKEDTSLEENTNQSGISRSLEKKLYPFYSNFISVFFMQVAFGLQQLFLNTDLGTGYLVQAKRVD